MLSESSWTVNVVTALVKDDESGGKGDQAPAKLQKTLKILRTHPQRPLPNNP
jgi:hypothetical protein